MAVRRNETIENIGSEDLPQAESCDAKKQEKISIMINAWIILLREKLKKLPGVFPSNVVVKIDQTRDDVLQELLGNESIKEKELKRIQVHLAHFYDNFEKKIPQMQSLQMADIYPLDKALEVTRISMKNSSKVASLIKEKQISFFDLLVYNYVRILMLIILNSGSAFVRFLTKGILLYASKGLDMEEDDIKECCIKVNILFTGEEGEFHELNISDSDDLQDTVKNAGEPEGEGFLGEMALTKDVRAFLKANDVTLDDLDFYSCLVDLIAKHRETAASFEEAEQMAYTEACEDFGKTEEDGRRIYGEITEKILI